MAEVRLLAVDSRHLSFIPPDMPFDTVAYEDLPLAGRERDLNHHGSTFIQFTSGSTSEPSGVVFTPDQIGANIESILEVLEPESGDVAVSWLPLSHDMGLIGMLLSSLTATHPRFAGGGTIGLMHPSTFIRSPWRWLQACAELEATFTAAPDFALQLATLSQGRVGSVDLSRLRACIVGGEVVRRSTLQAFEEAFHANGFSPLAFCPAYGLAEAALAVSMTPPNQRWRSSTTGELGIELGGFAVHDSDREFVSAGRILPRYSVTISGAGGVGEIIIDGPSVSGRYLAGNRRVEALHTRDIGTLSDQNLYVFGRSDDVVNIGARKVWLVDVDAAIDSTGLVRPGRGAGAASGTGEFVVAIEEHQSIEPARLASDVVRSVVDRVGHRPAAVAVLSRNSMPRTNSGKPRRGAIAEEVAANGPTVLHLTEFFGLAR